MRASLSGESSEVYLAMLEICLDCSSQEFSCPTELQNAAFEDSVGLLEQIWQFRRDALEQASAVEVPDSPPITLGLRVVSLELPHGVSAGEYPRTSTKATRILDRVLGYISCSRALTRAVSCQAYQPLSKMALERDPQQYGNDKVDASVTHSEDVPAMAENEQELYTTRNMDARTILGILVSAPSSNSSDSRYGIDDRGRHWRSHTSHACSHSYFQCQSC
jgi:hypothetical protein